MVIAGMVFRGSIHVFRIWGILTSEMGSETDVNCVSPNQSLSKRQKYNYH